MLIGITGGIGAGKSRVARLLGTLLECRVLSADDMCRQLLEQGEEGYLAFAGGSGSRYMGRDGKLDRKKLRADIFRDQRLKKELESILHPLVRRKLREESNRLEGQTMIIAEVPLLYESGWQEDFHIIIVVHTSSEVALARAGDRDGEVLSGIKTILEQQMDPEQKKKRADYVIYNSGAWPETVLQVESLAATLRAQLDDSGRVQ